MAGGSDYIVSLTAGSFLDTDRLAHPFGAASGTGGLSERAQGSHSADAARRRPRHLYRRVSHTPVCETYPFSMAPRRSDCPAWSHRRSLAASLAAATARTVWRC